MTQKEVEITVDIVFKILTATEAQRLFLKCE